LTKIYIFATKILYLQNLIKIVFGRSSVFLFISALDTLMKNMANPSSYLARGRLHQTPAIGQPVARMNVDMLAPKTLRAMICVAVATYLRAAILASEVLDRSFEIKTHLIKLLPAPSEDPKAAYKFPCLYQRLVADVIREIAEKIAAHSGGHITANGQKYGPACNDTEVVYEVSIDERKRRGKNNADKSRNERKYEMDFVSPEKRTKSLEDFHNGAIFSHSCKIGNMNLDFVYYEFLAKAGKEKGQGLNEGAHFGIGADGGCDRRRL